MNKEELVKYNIQQGIGLFLNTYLDEVNTEPASLEDWVSYVYHEVTTNFSTPDGGMEMGNKVLRFVGEQELKLLIAKEVVNDKEVQPYLVGGTC